MTDRPIIMSAPMIRAILAGRKTQTRRVLKPQPGGYDICVELGGGTFAHAAPDGTHMAGEYRLPCNVGERLWVRETVQADDHPEEDIFGVRYIADDHFAPLPDAEDARERHYVLRCYRSTDPDLDAYKPVPAIHMPRWASRITLHVTDVRVQRLQEISNDDCLAEGIDANKAGLVTVQGGPAMTAKAAYRDLWDSLNAKRGYDWEQNPWVVALTFRAEFRNIDQREAP